MKYADRNGGFLLSAILLLMSFGLTWVGDLQTLGVAVWFYTVSGLIGLLGLGALGACIGADK